MEKWKDIKGYEELYMVSNYGNVKAKERTIKGKDGVVKPFHEKMLKPNKAKVTKKHPRPHLTIELWKDNKRKRKSIHRLVAEAFIENPNNHPIINHIDGNPLNNRVENLEWCTYSHNNKHAIETGLKKCFNEKPIKGTNIRTGEVIYFESVAKASRFFGVTEGAIKAPLKGYGRSKCGCGYKWEYVVCNDYRKHRETEEASRVGNSISETRGTL